MEEAFDFLDEFLFQSFPIFIPLLFILGTGVTDLPEKICYFQIPIVSQLLKVEMPFELFFGKLAFE